jgi:hypothetical protein
MPSLTDQMLLCRKHLVEHANALLAWPTKRQGARPSGRFKVQLQLNGEAASMPRSVLGVSLKVSTEQLEACPTTFH